MRTAASFACLIALFFVGCATAPNVSPQPNIAAVRQQNQQTKGHIAKVKVSQGSAGQHLDRAEKDLNELLKE